MSVQEPVDYIIPCTFQRAIRRHININSAFSPNKRLHPQDTYTHFDKDVAKLMHIKVYSTFHLYCRLSPWGTRDCVAKMTQRSSESDLVVECYTAGLDLLLACCTANLIHKVHEHTPWRMLRKAPPYPLQFPAQSSQKESRFHRAL